MGNWCTTVSSGTSTVDEMPVSPWSTDPRPARTSPSRLHSSSTAPAPRDRSPPTTLSMMPPVAAAKARKCRVVPMCVNSPVASEHAEPGALEHGREPGSKSPRFGRPLAREPPGEVIVEIEDGRSPDDGPRPAMRSGQPGVEKQKPGIERHLVARQERPGSSRVRHSDGFCRKLVDPALPHPEHRHHAGRRPRAGCRIATP